MTKGYQHCAHKERTLIYWWQKENLSRRAIAQRVQRSPSSISRELLILAVKTHWMKG